MASITIRNLDEKTKRKLQLRASRYGRSMEEEARTILRKALEPQNSQRGLGTAIHELFKSIGGSDLEPMPREPLSAPPDFSSW
jgi:antitoxin FitA